MANFESSDADRVFNEALWIVQAEQDQISARDSLTTAAVMGAAGVANTVISMAIGSDLEVTSFADFVRESTHMLFGVTGIAAMGIAAFHLFCIAELKSRKRGQTQ
jgi:hypothetical protein